MDAIDLLRYQVRDTYEWLEMTLADVSDEEANWQPAGTANSIGSAYAHLVLSADADINSRLYGCSPLAAEYGGRIGLSEMPPFGADWDEWASAVSVDWEALRRYGRAVHQGIEERLRSISVTVLERQIDMSFHGLGTWRGLDLYNLQGINHPRIHGGEIACLKGLQGGRGWSQGPVSRG